jgi:hypothetical protein
MPEWIDEYHFAMLLGRIKDADESLEIRHRLILEALPKAGALGYKAGFMGDAYYIDLPTGHVSWKIEPVYEDVTERFFRINEYLRDVMARSSFNSDRRSQESQKSKKSFKKAAPQESLL